MTHRLNQENPCLTKEKKNKQQNSLKIRLWAQTMAQEKARRCKGISGNLNTKLPAKVAALTLQGGRDSSALRSLDSSLTEVCRTKAHAWDQERASETRGGQREGGTQSTHEHKGKNRTQLLKQNKSHPTSQQQPDVSHPPPRRHR